MHHSVPAPALPPDPDDLYAPPQHLRVGQMASLVWSVMRLSSTNTDFAWCTVCRKWYRYRSDFNAAYIKTLFKHCKTQHYVAEDGTLKPVTTTIPQTRRLTPTSPPQVAQQLPIISATAGVSSAQQLASMPPVQPYSGTIPLVPTPTQTPTSNITKDLSQHIMLYRAQKLAQAELARAQAARARVAAFSGLPGASQQQANMATFQAASKLAGISAQRANSAGPTPTVDLTTGTVSNVTSANHGATALPSSSMGSISPNLAASATILQQQLNSANNNAITKSQALAMVSYIQNQRALVHRQALHQRHMMQMQQLLQSFQGQSQQSGSPPVVQNQLTSQDGASVTVNVPSAGQAAPNALGSTGRAAAPSVTAFGTQPGAADAATADLMAAKTPQIGAGAGNSAQNSVTQKAGGPNMPRPAPDKQAIASDGNLLALPSTPLGSATAAAKTASSNSAISAAPLRGAIVKRTGARRVPPMMTSVTRCELTAPVTRVAERSQNLIFSGTSLFFADAAFQVPSTEEEAMETMRKGTADVDKDGSGPSNDLYFVSWSHTQFFAAQMAALGYRFLSSNLKRKAKQTQPPPVKEWLRLQKYQSVPRPLQSASTVSPDANPSTTREPHGSTSSNPGVVPNSHADATPEQSIAGSNAPGMSPVPPVVFAPSSSVPVASSGPTGNAVSPEMASGLPTAASDIQAAPYVPGQTALSPMRSRPVAPHVSSHSPAASVPPNAPVRPKMKEIPIIDLT